MKIARSPTIFEMKKEYVEGGILAPFCSRFSPNRPSIRFGATLLMMAFLLVGCSRSPWVKLDGDEVSPREHVECAQQVQQHS